MVTDVAQQFYSITHCKTKHVFMHPLLHVEHCSLSGVHKEDETFACRSLEEFKQTSIGKNRKIAHCKSDVFCITTQVRRQAEMRTPNTDCSFQV